MICDLCSARAQCSPVGVCSACVVVLQQGTATAARVAELEAALAEERSNVASWRSRALASQERVAQLELELAECDRAADELVDALEGQ